MVEFMSRRFAWLVFVAACQSAPATTAPDCHFDGIGSCATADCTWKSAAARACAEGWTAYACKDASGRVLEGMAEALYGYSFDAKGQQIGMWADSDIPHDTCSRSYWGVLLSCDLTPVDLACPVTN
jgi:hypothetical protein